MPKMWTIEIINNEARQNLMQNADSVLIVGARSFRKPLGQTKVIQIHQGETIYEICCLAAQCGSEKLRKTNSVQWSQLLRWPSWGASRATQSLVMMSNEREQIESQGHPYFSSTPTPPLLAAWRHRHRARSPRTADPAATGRRRGALGWGSAPPFFSVECPVVPG